MSIAGEFENMLWGGTIRWQLGLREGYALVGVPAVHLDIEVFNPAKTEWRPEFVAVGA
jgi:hypothetical protein